MISIVIPHWGDVPGADEAFDWCCLSLEWYITHADFEFLPVYNDGIGYAKAVNLGLERSTGDYIIVMNNDVQLISGELSDLTDPFGVTVPAIDPQPRDNNPRAVFCLPRWVYKEVGPLDERFQGGYFEDDDYIRRLNVHRIPIYYKPQVFFKHLNGGGNTMKYIGEQKFYDQNKKVYEDKWRDIIEI